MKWKIICLCAFAAFLSCEGWEVDDAGKVGEDEGINEEFACSISEARERVGEKDVCVKAYIVGGDLTTSATGISFEQPFSSSTNLAVADSLTVTEKSSCLSVQLPAGRIRQALNLVDNPDNFGKEVYLKGDIVASYFGIVGLKNVSDFVLK